MPQSFAVTVLPTTAPVKAAPACRVLRTEGGWYAVLQVPTFRPEEELVLDLLINDGILTYPGYFFDFSRESYLVISLLVPEADGGLGLTFATLGAFMKYPCTSDVGGSKDRGRSARKHGLMSLELPA